MFESLASRRFTYQHFICRPLVGHIPMLFVPHG